MADGLDVFVPFPEDVSCADNWVISSKIVEKRSRLFFIRATCCTIVALISL